MTNPKKFADPDDRCVNTSTVDSFDVVLKKRISRRDHLKQGLALGLGAIASGTLMSSGPLAAATKNRADQLSSLHFHDIAHASPDQFGINVADGYQADILLRWGDPILKAAKPFDPLKVSGHSQLTQFGYNNDFIAFMPIDGHQGQRSDRGLLCVNHEYTNRELMTPEPLPDAQLMALEMAAHGHSVIEVTRQKSGWQYLQDSPYNRRISAAATDCLLSGPAAGAERMKTASDPQGMTVRGTLNNCAGGKTPWGTVLIAEENFNLYFGEQKTQGREARSHGRYGIGAKSRYPHWAEILPRFNPALQPHEPNRFGWMVEIDPYDPNTMPIKRTALGRFKHEGASVVINRDGRVVVYSADDQYFEYIYRFVSDKPYDPDNHAANADILDAGTLSVARFDADGSLRWLPLVFGEEPLTPRFGFYSDADIMIDTRLAGDRVGATPMDRPEEVSVNPNSGIVFAALTKNKHRRESNVNPPNPRVNNRTGHIIAMVPPGRGPDTRDHAADVFAWDIFLQCGDPMADGSGAEYGEGTARSGWFANPDNLAFDPDGRLWVATDGAPHAGLADGLWACDTTGSGQALTKHFFNTPAGAELCGPEFTPDGETLFLAVQHPGERSTYANPSTRWPAEPQSGLPPRPSVVAITKTGGGRIGS